MMLKRINAATVNAIATAIRSMLMRFWVVGSGRAILSSILLVSFGVEDCLKGKTKPTQALSTVAWVPEISKRF